ncbi:MAG: hypothetical protein HYY44_02455 [Deltaproteobacteria bacterium]|nr:hypothetical protein [Deltaproteobacteria bacterium]MBI4373464.1 hypothetical protein [Deltaproteobacteria bacterium]
MFRRLSRVLLFLLTVFPAQAADPVQDRINLENSITSQLKNELGSLLPPNSYAVFTSVQLDIIRVREMVEGEQVKLKAPTAEAVPNLPGFLPSVEGEGGTEQERQVYTMREKVEVAKVSVRVLFDDGLKPATIDIAKSAIGGRLRASFGEKATAQFETVDLVSGRGDWTENDLAGLLMKYRWILLALLGLTLFLFYLLSRRRRREMSDPVVVESERPMKPGHSLSPQGNSHGEIVPEKEANGEGQEQRLLAEASVPPLSATLQDLIEEISAHPLIARNFLKKLDAENKKLLYSCFETSSLRDALGSILGINEDRVAEGGFEGQSDADVNRTKRIMLSNIHHEFQQYRKLVELQQRQKFGFLSLLTGGEIVRLLSSQNDETLPLVMKYLPKDISKQILNTLSPPQKKALLAQLTRNSEITEAKVDQVESVMKERVSRLSQEIFMPFAKNESLMDIIVEESHDAKELLGDLLASDPSLHDKYSHYLLGIDDFLEQEPALINLCLETLPNEEVALALMGLEPHQKERIRSVLPEGRRKVVSALLVSHGEGTSPEEIESAKRRLLQILRQKRAKSPPG